MATGNKGAPIDRRSSPIDRTTEALSIEDQVLYIEEPSDWPFLMHKAPIDKRSGPIDRRPIRLAKTRATIPQTWCFHPKLINKVQTKIFMVPMNKYAWYMIESSIKQRIQQLSPRSINDFN